MNTRATPAATLPFPLLVFDLDGTLVDSAADIAEALNRTLDDQGLPRADEATVRGWIGDGVTRLVQQALQHHGRPFDADAVMPGFMQHYRDCLLRSPRLYDGVAEALQQLRARAVPLAICTNKPEAMVRPLLAHLGLGDVFACIVGGDTLPQRKPSGEPLRHVAAHFGLATGQCLMVGDSLTDYRAAQDAGMPIALVSYGYPRGLDLHAAYAVAVLDDLRQLPGLAGPGAAAAGDQRGW